MKISIQDAGTCDTLGFEAGYAAIAKAGFDAIDWNIDHALRAADIKALNLGNCIFEKDLPEILAYYDEELAIIRKNGLTVTQCHAPFPAYIPGHPEVLDYMIGIYKYLILFRLSKLEDNREGIGYRNRTVSLLSWLPLWRH